MDFSNLSFNQLLGAFSAASFVIGCIVARAFFPGNGESKKEDPRNHTIRELEADNRLLRREQEEHQQALDDKNAEFQTAVETLQSVRTSMSELESEAQTLRTDNQASIAKIHELRRELQERATESVREHMRAEDAETELQVARAGSDAVMSEINRLHEERDRLTNTMRDIEGQVAMDLDSELRADAQTGDT